MGCLSELEMYLKSHKECQRFKMWNPLILACPSAHLTQQKSNFRIVQNFHSTRWKQNYLNFNSRKTFLFWFLKEKYYYKNHVSSRSPQRNVCRFPRVERIQQESNNFPSIYESSVHIFVLLSKYLCMWGSRLSYSEARLKQYSPAYILLT